MMNCVHCYLNNDRLKRKLKRASALLWLAWLYFYSERRAACAFSFQLIDIEGRYLQFLQTFFAFVRDPLPPSLDNVLLI